MPGHSALIVLLDQMLEYPHRLKPVTPGGVALRPRDSDTGIIQRFADVNLGSVFCNGITWCHFKESVDIGPVRVLHCNLLQYVQVCRVLRITGTRPAVRILCTLQQGYIQAQRQPLETLVAASMLLTVFSDAIPCVASQGKYRRNRLQRKR